MMKSMLDLPKQVQHLARYVEVFGTGGIKAESIQIGGAANTIIRMGNLDSLPTVCQKTEPLPYKLS